MPCFRVAPGQLDRCSGHCCYGFVVGDGWSPSELKVMAYAQANLPAWDHNYEDLQQIADMVIPMGLIPSVHRATSEEAERPYWRYTCKHLGEYGDCKDYNNRPSMCRNHPYMAACEFSDCTMNKKAQMESFCGGDS